MAFKSTRRSRRNRNNPQPEQKTNKPFFQAKEDPATTSDSFFQPKLKIGEPGDRYEQEADAVADAVVGGNQRNAISGESQAVQRMPDSDMEKDKMIQEKPEEEEVQMMEEEEPVQMMDGGEEEEPVQMMGGQEEEEPIQMMGGEEEEESLQMMEEEEAVQTKSQTGSSSTASTQLTQQLHQQAGRGRTMDKSTQSQMESGIGHDFSQVNIHTDESAVQMNKELGARAFTRGKDVYFNRGQYQPETSDGQRLLAHELTHTVQQGAVGPKNIAPDVQKEAETDTTGNHTGNYIFRNNAFFRRVRSRVADGPLTDDELIDLKQDAIQRNGSVLHAELLLMAAALDSANATSIHGHRTGNFILPMTSVSAAHRQHIQDVDRGTLSPDVLAARTVRDGTADGSEDRESAETELMIAANNQIEQELAGSSFAPKGIELVTQMDVPLDLVLEAMLNAASDSTAGDKAMAGVAYVVAKQYNHPMASQLRTGALQVDALIPRVYRRIVGGGDAAYQYSTAFDVRKADTLYLPTNITLMGILDRALIIHELTHANDDFSATGTRQVPEVDLEKRAYIAQSKYILDQFKASPPHPDSDAMKDASGLAKSDKTHYWAYIAATKANVSHYEATLRSILTAAPLSMSAADITADLGKSATDIDTALTTALLNMKDGRGRNLYSSTKQTTLDGPAGQFFN